MFYIKQMQLHILCIYNLYILKLFIIPHQNMLLAVSKNKVLQYQLIFPLIQPDTYYATYNYGSSMLSWAILSL